MTTGILILAGVLVAGMLLRMPIGFSMLASGVAYLLVKRQDVGLVAEQVGNGLYNSYVLLAVPLFVFAANIMNAGTVSERIFDFCRILVGRMRGGLAQVDRREETFTACVAVSVAAGSDLQSAHVRRTSHRPYPHQRPRSDGVRHRQRPGRPCCHRRVGHARARYRRSSGDGGRRHVRHGDGPHAAE